MSADATTHTDCDCPSAEELRRLARGHLTDARQAQLTGHLDQCPGCQCRLDEIAADGDKLYSACMRKLCEPPAPKESAYWEAMSQVELAVTGVTPSDGTADSVPNLNPHEDLKLDFLQPTDKPGRLGRLGAFDVIRVVGRGGMGVVLAAFDESLQREVAIKILDPQLKANETARQRFCREARAAAKVSHDNIVAVYQVSEDETASLPYFVMQLVNGETLEDRLRRQGKLTVEETVRIGMQAAAGLAAAHEHQLIHRDIKPANILIDKLTNKVKLTDFGLARAAEDLKLTRTGFVAGTPLYMAPEQARGDEIDVRSDLFSLGSVLYESLSGRPPFEGKTPLVVLRRLTDELHEPIHKVNPDVPDWLEDILDKLLEKDPEKRYQSAAELANELAQHYACIKPPSMDKVEACPLSPSRTWRNIIRSRSQRKAAVFLAATFLLGALLGSLGTVAFGPTREVRVEVPAEVAKNGVAVAAPSNGGEPRGPNELQTTKRLSGAVWSLTSSPDGKMVIAGLEDGSIVSWDLKNNGTITTLGKHDGPVWSVDLAPDGKTYISSSDDGSVKVWDIVSDKPIAEIKNDVSVRSAAMNPEKTHVVTGDRMGNVKIWSIARPETPEKVFKHAGIINAVAFGPDSLLIASGSTNKTVILWERNTGKNRGIMRGHEGPVYGVAFSPEGDTLATASWDHNVMLWNTSDGTPIKTIKDAHEEGIWAISFSCCGKVLATAGQEGLVKVWNVEDGKELRQFSRHKGTVHAVHFTDGGKQLFTGGRDGTIKLWQVKDGSP
jgi:serine/threonine protein kinase